MFYVTLVNLGYSILGALFCQFYMFCAHAESTFVTSSVTPGSVKPESYDPYSVYLELEDACMSSQIQY